MSDRLKSLKVKRGGYNYKPVLDRTPDHQTIRERAEFLAHEIFDYRLAPELEIADAIDTEIRRFAADSLADLLADLESELKDFKSLPLHGATNEHGWLQARGEVYCMERIIRRLRAAQTPEQSAEPAKEQP